MRILPIATTLIGNLHVRLFLDTKWGGVWISKLQDFVDMTFFLFGNSL